MASIHIWNSMAKAADKGGYAGNPETLPLWELSKRELVEIALRLGEISGDDFSLEGALARVEEERVALVANGII